MLVFSSGCVSTDETLLDGLSEEIKIDISFGEVVDHVETHGGFLGDGQTYVEVRFTEEETILLIDEISSSQKWKELPTSEELNVALYGGQIGDAYWSSFVESEQSGIPALPNVENGYYFFENHNYAANGLNDEAAIFDSYSFNFTVALFDVDNNRIFFFDFDT
jgi:hypothetical protein